MGDVGDRDLVRSSSNHLLDIFPPMSSENHHHPQNPNNHRMIMTSQNPNSSANSLLNHGSNYEPQPFYPHRLSLNPNANEYYHQLIMDHQNHVFNRDQSLAAAFNRLNLNHAATPPPPMAGSGFGAIARPPSSPLYPNSPQEQDYYYLQYFQDLHKKRIESAVKGHAYFNNNDNYMNNDILGLMGASGSGSVLGAHRLSRSSFGGSHLPLANPYSSYNNSIRPSLGRKYSNGSRPEFGRRGRSINRSNLDNSYTNILASSSSSSSSTSHRQRQSYSSLEELKGRIGLAAKEQHGCRFLQKKLEEGHREEIDLIFSEMLDNLEDLIVDQFGNYLIQKLFEVCNEAQITKIVYSPAISNEKKLMAVCTNDHGTRAIQRLLEFVTTSEQRYFIVSVFRRIGLPLMKDQKGHHVIQQCLRVFPFGDTEYLYHQVADNCLDLALDRQGCCVLQLCLSQANGEYLERLLSEIALNSLALSVNCYGNYVLQFVLEMQRPQATANIVAQLFGNYVTLSMNKCASNVVEKCLLVAVEDQATDIIRELLSSTNFLNICQDSYGNYVVQTALKVSKGDLHKYLTNHIVKVLYPFLQSHPHGKNVLQEAKPSKHRTYKRK